MKDISLAENPGEHAMYMHAKRIYYSSASIRAANSNIEIYCEICSGYIMPALLFAIHITVPKIIENLLRPLFGGTDYHCIITCKNTPHLHKISPFSSLQQYLIIGRD